jgi:hypothetical protein
MVRLRITRQPSGSIDGIHLDDFIVGFVYDVGTTLGCYLLSDGAAEPVADDTPALVVPFQRVRFDVRTPRSKVVRPDSSWRAIAADRAPRTPKKKKPRATKKKN